MITKAMYIERRGESLKVLELEIARLMDYTDRVTAEVAVKYFEAINRLQAMRDTAAKKLRELHAVSDAGWMGDDATLSMEDVWTDLRNAVLAAITTIHCETSRSNTQTTRHQQPTPRQSRSTNRFANFVSLKSAHR